VGFSLGIGLAILWIGLFILAGVMAASWGFSAMERGMAISMLKVQIAPMSVRTEEPSTFWQRIKYFMTNPVTWKGLLFLLLKFPIGLAVFVFCVVGVTIPVTFISAPLIYRSVDIQILGPVWHVDTLPESLVLFVLGIPLLSLFLYASNWIAQLLGELAKSLLGAKQARPPSQQMPDAGSESSAPPEAPLTSQ
jgi:hypothetical protein